MKIAFISTNQNFCETIIRELQEHHEVKNWRWTRNKDIDTPNLMGLIEWADLLYFDFIQYPLPFVTSMQWLDKPIVCRMDGIDILGHHQVDWNKVQGFVLMPVQEARLARLREQWHRANPGKTLAPLPKRILRRNIGIDLQMFQPDWDNQPSYNIVLHASVVRATKGVYLALQTFYELLQQDPDKPWHLFLVGQWRGGWNWPNREEYVMATEELVDTLDIPEDRLTLIQQNFTRPRWAEFLRDMADIYWCMSFREGFPNSMGEGCASGVWPLANWFYAAETIYPEENLCKTPMELLRKTIEWGNLPLEEKQHKRREIRTHIEQYSRRGTAADIRKLCEEVYEAI